MSDVPASFFASHCGQLLCPALLLILPIATRDCQINSVVTFATSIGKCIDDNNQALTTLLFIVSRSQRRLSRNRRAKSFFSHNEVGRLVMCGVGRVHGHVLHIDKRPPG